MENQEIVTFELREATLLQGYLIKKSDFLGKNNRRYLVLSRGSIAYYNDEADAKTDPASDNPKGRIALFDALVDLSEETNCLTVRGNEVTFVLCPDPEVEGAHPISLWHEKLQAEIDASTLDYVYSGHSSRRVDQWLKQQASQRQEAISALSEQKSFQKFYRSFGSVKDHAKLVYFNEAKQAICWRNPDSIDNEKQLELDGILDVLSWPESHELVQQRYNTDDQKEQVKKVPTSFLC